ncbi:MAG: aminomethyl-transferring glycine dehydrogenase subunit GcvPB [Candidatus Izemoplasmatales bacterium]|nr:aminomethyl-transferring glycine dehydrogenase subunit GcvPB [Candidatus Izemoplasmatales bacterium]
MVNDARMIFERSIPGRIGFQLPKGFGHHALSDLGDCLRGSEPILPEVFELDVIRHYTHLSNKNFGVETNLYPLGSCTMKYNPKINEEIAGLKGFNDIHPLQPSSSVQGWLKVYDDMQKMLSEISGLAQFSLNPYAGAHGELAGLMIMKAYHEKRGDHRRTKVIVPDSAHGTNPASCAVCGMQIIEIASNASGRIDLDALKAVLSDEVAGMMLTNPNTLGMFESDICAITRLVHEAGGLMYYDGANLNAILGKARPGDMGFDIMHINLHKTFSTPHGGGGPGSGPVGVIEALKEFLPSPQVDVHDGHYFVRERQDAIGRISSWFGNSKVWLKAYAYILTLGKEYLKWVGPLSTLNANYIKALIQDLYHLPIKGICMHECVFDGLADPSTGIKTLDVAKRLLDYGFHAPTIYFPLLFHQSIMIEPTETESKQSLDAFVEVMRTIAEEAKEHPELLKNAPLTTPVRRIDEVMAAKRLILHYKDYCDQLETGGK